MASCSKNPAYSYRYPQTVTYCITIGRKSPAKRSKNTNKLRGIFPFRRRMPRDLKNREKHAFARAICAHKENKRLQKRTSDRYPCRESPCAQRKRFRMPARQSASVSVRPHEAPDSAAENAELRRFSRLSRQKARIQTPGPAAQYARRGRAPFDPLQIQLSIFYGLCQTIDCCSSIRISIFVNHIIIYAASFHISVARQLNPA